MKLGNPYQETVSAHASKYGKPVITIVVVVSIIYTSYLVVMEFKTSKDKARDHIHGIRVGNLGNSNMNANMTTRNEVSSGTSLR